MKIVLSIVIPLLNEEDHIKPLIEKLISIPPFNKEIILVDGGSTDNTIKFIKQEINRNLNIKLLHNKEKYASQAFNLGYRNSSGEYIAFVGAHANYSDNYFQLGVDLLNQGVSSAIGGILVQKGNGIVGEAIALCMSSKFGVGNTEFRTTKIEGYVQSVAFAIYGRRIFEDIGLMDVDLIRNQDDEFHYRMGKFGYKIFMSTQMIAEYYVRNSIFKLFRQYFEYGLYKPLVIKKVNSGFKLRHAIPAFFVLYLLILFTYSNKLFLIPLIIYLVLDLFFSFILKTNNIKKNLMALLVFPTLHISYGLGTLVGIFKALSYERNR
jgi:glycosyltransferase involved in cell wall biosynthesis